MCFVPRFDVVYRNYLHFRELAGRSLPTVEVLLYLIDGVVIAALMHCDLFGIYCDPPNLGITRKWTWRLNFAQRPIFSGLRFFNEPEISDSGPPALYLPGYLCSEKIHRPQSNLNPPNLESRGEHVTPRPPRQTTVEVKIRAWHILEGNDLYGKCIHLYGHKFCTSVCFQNTKEVSGWSGRLMTAICLFHDVSAWAVGAS